MKALIELVRGFVGQPQLLGEVLQRIAFVEDLEHCIEDFQIRDDAHGWTLPDKKDFFVKILGGELDETLSDDELVKQIEEGGLEAYSFEDDGLAIDVLWFCADGSCGIFFRVWYEAGMIAAVVYDSLDEEFPWRNLDDWKKKNLPEA